MDAVKFIEERRRMYKVTGKHLPALAEWVPAEEVVKEVEQWSKEHPRKTRQSVFLEQYPNAKVNAKGIVEIWPCDVEKNMQTAGRCNGIYCVDCSREFWMQEVE